MVLVATAVFGEVVMRLWNWLMPAIFGLRTLNFVQALGLLLLTKILFGGFHRHAGGRRWKRHMQERFANMTPEQRRTLSLRDARPRHVWIRPCGYRFRADSGLVVSYLSGGVTMTSTPPHESSPESTMSLASLLHELRHENARLQRLVLELLYKNQQLRSDA